jgi:hypothetical protein
MKLLRPKTFLLGALLFPAGTASGQDSFLQLIFSDQKVFQITGTNQFEYQGGQWVVTLIDGEFPILPCFANGGTAYQPPVDLPPCPAGTTTLITQGDVDGDGVRDLGIYFSTDQPIPASTVQPFLAEQIFLDAAPPSDLPRPVAAFNWTDTSIRGFYDIIADPINGVGYDVSFYQSTRPYEASENGLEQQRDEIVPGVYRFNFPALGSTREVPRSVLLSVAHNEMVEASPGPGGRSVVSGGVFVGNDFLLEDDRWNEDGSLEIDPRLGFAFNWEGFNPTTFRGNDVATFAILNREDGSVRFPPIPPPPPLAPPNPETRQIIGSSQIGIPTGFDLGPDFFAPDELLVAELLFQRNNVSGSSIDGSARLFRWNIDLIDSYPGFTTGGFPPGTTEAQAAPDFDFDGDGFTNLEEFGLQTDPVDPASVPNVTPTLNSLTGQCILDIAKRPAIGNSLTYLIQASVDLENWVTIDSNNPDWFLIFDNDERITVLSRQPAGQNPCFLRVRFQQN